MFVLSESEYRTISVAVDGSKSRKERNFYRLLEK